MARLLVLAACLLLARAGGAQTLPCEGCPGNAAGVSSWVKGELLVAFPTGTAESLVERVAAEEGARVERLVIQDPPRWLWHVPVGTEREAADRVGARAEVEAAVVNSGGCVPEAPPASCCRSNVICDGLPACDVVEVSGLRVRKLEGRRRLGLELSWSSSCGAPDFAIVQGLIGDFDAKWSVDCSDDQGSPLVERLDAPSGDLFFLVTALQVPWEGSMGVDSMGFKRAPAVGDCALGDQLLPCCD